MYRSDGLLQSTQDEYTEFAASLVDATMSFVVDSSRSADAQRAKALQDLPFELYEEESRLREAVRRAVADPEGAAKLVAVRAVLLDRTREEGTRRLDRLRAQQREAAEVHGAEVGFQTVAAWSVPWSIS